MIDTDISYFRNMGNLLDQCMDNYLFIFDINNDTYYISPHALDRFDLDKNEFSNPVEVFKSLVYYRDYDILINDLNEVMEGKKQFHNLQYRWLDKNQLPIWINCRGNVIYHDNKPCYLVGCINEIGKKQVADNASGLLGEMSFKNFIIPIKDDFHQGFVLRIGIDNFKNINENYGVKYGDHILMETGKCIKKHLLEHQDVYRIVADEFVIIDLKGDGNDAKKLYNRIRESILEFIEEKNYEAYYTISAGILDFNTNPTANYVEIMKWTEFALSEAKKAGKNKARAFNSDDYALFKKKTALLRCLHQAVDQGFKGFEVHFQPIVDVNEQEVTSLEALLRFRCEEFSNVSPADFIPLLEESDLIIPVGKWVLEQSAKAILALKDIINVKIHVNLSYVQVLKTAILKDILSVISKYNINNEQLVVELTESGFIESNNNFIHFCNNLKKNNIPLALDDFGTGYSNFHYLYHLKPEYIKINRGLTKNALCDAYENKLLQHMIDMAHSVDVKMCIEGIETKDELDKILDMSTDYIQGFYYCKPCSLTDLKTKLINKEVL